MTGFFSEKCRSNARKVRHYFLHLLAANLKKVFARYDLVVLLATVDTVALTDAHSNPLVAIWRRNTKDRIRTWNWTTTIERKPFYSYSIMIMTMTSFSVTDYTLLYQQSAVYTRVFLHGYAVIYTGLGP